MKRRIFSVLIALALCLSLLPVTALAEGAGTAEDPWSCGDGVTAWLSDDGTTLTISHTGEGSGAMTDYTFSRERPWDSKKESILRAVIEEGVTSIGSNTFYYCQKLTSVEIPESVTSIGKNAFNSCKGLSGIQLPSGLTSIGASAFSYCRALTSIKIPNGVKTIGDTAFSSTSLTEVTIPDGVESIGMYAFSACNSLTTVNIPASVEKIGKDAFVSSPNAEIHYEGTLAKWNSISGGNSGASQDKIATNGDATGNVTVDGSLFKSGVREGETVTVYAGTKYGYAFAGWTAEGVTLAGDQAANPNLTFTMPGEAVTLTAAWEEAVADVNNVGYTTVQAAFDAIGSGSGRVYLLKDVTVDQPIKMSQGSVTLESEKKTLTGTGSSTLEVTGGYLYVENVTVANTNDSGWGISARSGAPNITIRNTATVSGPNGGIYQVGETLTVAGTVKGTGTGSVGINALGTTLTINEGAVISEGANGYGIAQGGGKLTVNGGTISGRIGLSVVAWGEKDATVSLKGGKFIGSGTNNSAIAASGVNDALRALSTLLDPGYTIYKEDGTALTAEELEKNRTGPGTFTVGCAHASVENVTSSGPDESGVVTVTATCEKCGQTVTLGTLTMVGSGQTITLVDKVPTFEVQVQGLTVTSYKWPESFKLDTDQPRAEPAIDLEKVMANPALKFPCEVTFQTPGGGSSKVTLPFTLTVDPLDNSGAEISVHPVPDNVTYDGKEHAFLTSQVGIEIAGKYIFGFPDCFDIQLVDASGAAEKQTDAGTYTVQLTGTGCFKGTAALKNPFVIEPATSSIAWPEGTTEEKLTYTGEAAELKTTPTVTVAGMTSYDGEAVTYSYATAEAGPYTPGLPTDAGTYYIKAAVPQQKNYTAAETAGPPLKLTIQKAATTVTPPTAANPAYNGKPQALVTAAETSVGEVQYALREIGPWSKDIPTATLPGEYTVWYKVEETDNYTGVAAKSVTAKIEKATVTAIGPSLMIKNNQEKTYTLDLRPYLPTLPQGQEYGKLTYELTEVNIGDSDYIAGNTVNLVDTVLTVPVNKVDNNGEDSIGRITVTIKSDNFQDIPLTVSVTATNKTPLIITGVTAQGWTYDGTVHPGYTGTPRAEGYTGEFQVTYFTQGKDRKDAGTFEVWFEPMDTNYAGDLRLPYTVEQAQVTVKAEDKTAYVGEEMPTLTYTVDGLVGEDTLTGELTPACTPDMTKAGSYPITISGGEVPAGGNYKEEIVYQNGTLTVKEKSAPPKPVDPGQVETKTEVEEGISQVPEGLKNIPALNSPAKLETAMRTAVTQTGVPAQNTAVYDVKLMVSTDGGRTWVPATSANFPSGGLTVTLPYPAGTDSSYTFTVVHMFTTAAFGKTPGDTESPTVTNTEAGLRFTVTGLSPISVGWKEKEPSRPSGGGDSGSSVSTYRVTVERTAHGKVTSNRTYASEDSTVTLTVTPDSAYVLDTLAVTDSRGKAVKLTDKGDGRYTFSMPSRAVTVTASFASIAWSNPYTDVATGAWYYEAVRFVNKNGLMGGYSSGLFGPNDTLTRAQFAQILFNKESRPVVNYLLQYNDVADGAWYTEAVRWAASQGVAGGYGNGMFGPNDNTTREQLAVMLWRYAGSPVATDKELHFNDANEISAFALEAMRWAVENGVMGGYGNGQLAPKGLATRAQAAQMLKNFLEK